MKINRTHNCWQCKKQRLGRCYGYIHHGEDVSGIKNTCPQFVYGIEAPDNLFFDNKRQLINYIKEYFYTTDFKEKHTRKQLCLILNLLYPNVAKENGVGLQFTSMCKERMVKHIEFYIKLHNLNCKGGKPL